jgi:hypothetical protein
MFASCEPTRPHPTTITLLILTRPLLLQISSFAWPAHQIKTTAHSLFIPIKMAKVSLGAAPRQFFAVQIVQLKQRSSLQLTTLEP